MLSRHQPRVDVPVSTRTNSVVISNFRWWVGEDKQVSAAELPWVDYWQYISHTTAGQHGLNHRWQCSSAIYGPSAWILWRSGFWNLSMHAKSRDCSLCDGHLQRTKHQTDGERPPWIFLWAPHWSSTYQTASWLQVVHEEFLQRTSPDTISASGVANIALRTISLWASTILCLWRSVCAAWKHRWILRNCNTRKKLILESFTVCSCWSFHLCSISWHRRTGIAPFLLSSDTASTPVWYRNWKQPATSGCSSAFRRCRDKTS